jgi:hypothetical protein
VPFLVVRISIVKQIAQRVFVRLANRAAGLYVRAAAPFQPVHRDAVSGLHRFEGEADVSCSLFHGLHLAFHAENLL